MKRRTKVIWIILFVLLTFIVSLVRTKWSISRDLEQRAREIQEEIKVKEELLKNYG
jgi:predicted Holliday junction resolvase-like endonuclease